MKRVAIITSSDMGYQGKREDLSGPAIKEIVEREGYQVVSMDILPDDRSMLSKRMAEIADENLAELILTTGGTGFSPRDVMPEATEDITERKVPDDGRYRFLAAGRNAGSDTCGNGTCSSGNPGGHPCLQHDHHKPRHVKPCYSWNPQTNPDHQPSWKPESSKGKFGVYNRHIRPRH